MARIPRLKDFEGRWMLTRTIEDKRAGKTGKLAGEASFSPDGPGGLIYFENGELSYGGAPGVMATRAYLWRSIKAGIEVSFDDNSPFHVIAADRLMPDAIHHCDPDIYNVSYDFTHFPDWSATWRVVGPAKDCRMVSSYTRP